MSHFTFHSGQDTTTVTLRCPECLALRPIPRCKAVPSAMEICCPVHFRAYIANLVRGDLFSVAVKAVTIRDVIASTTRHCGRLSERTGRYAGDHGIAYQRGGNAADRKSFDDRESLERSLHAPTPPPLAHDAAPDAA